MSVTDMTTQAPERVELASRLSLDVLGSHERLEARRCWQELEERLGFQGLSCSFDWTDSWLNSFGDLIPHEFLLLKNQPTESVEGICLISEGVGQKAGPCPIRTLHVGTAGEPDADSVCVEYNRLLVSPHCKSAFSERIVNYLQKRRGFDQWNLDGFLAAELSGFEAFEPGLLKQIEPAYGFDLTQARRVSSNVLAKLKSATRRKVKRNLKAFTGVKAEWIDELNTASDAFSEMVHLHQARWNAAGQPGAYASPRFLAFHEELLSRLVPQRRLAFVRVRSTNGTVGIVQLFIEHNRALAYQNGRIHITEGFSPGVVVDYLAMEECLQRDLDAYDFLAFATQHKRHLSNMSSDIVWARKRRSRLKFALIDGARQLKQRLKGNTK